MNRTFRIITTQHEDNVEWELVESHGAGHCRSEAEAYSDAEAHRRQIVSRLPPDSAPVPGPMDSKPANQVVTQELTAEQRQQLY